MHSSGWGVLTKTRILLWKKNTIPCSLVHLYTNGSILGKDKWFVKSQCESTLWLRGPPTVMLRRLLERIISWAYLSIIMLVVTRWIHIAQCHLILPPCFPLPSCASSLFVIDSQENKNRLIVQFRFVYISYIIFHTVINFFDFLKHYVMLINSVLVDIRHIVCLLFI